MRAHQSSRLSKRPSGLAVEDDEHNVQNARSFSPRADAEPRVPSDATHHERRRTRYSEGASRRTSSIRDSRFALDARCALKAFRLIGGFDGIQLDELREAISTVQDVHVRNSLLKNIDAIFAQFDEDENGILDVLEFEQMVQSSTILQQAVYELLDRAENEERLEYMAEKPDAKTRDHARKGKCIDVTSVVTTLLYVVNLAIQTDVSPKWLGWQFVELGFLVVFTIEFVVRCFWSTTLRRRETCMGDFLYFLATPMGVFDLVIITMGWIEIGFMFSNGDDKLTIVATLRWIRVLRVLRCVRLMRIFWYCQELRVLIEGILSGMQAAIWGLAMIFLIVFIWAIVIRTAVSNNWTSESDNKEESFRSIPESMLVVFRCMALSADGACMEKPHEFGWVFDVCWAASEAFVLVGILNVIASVYVVQAAENANRIQESINQSCFRDDLLRTQKLDKLLRTLIHPGREQSNPKDRNAADVAVMIRTAHPEAAAKIHNLEMQLVHFAQSIQDAKKLHQSAMDVYESQEVKECRQLRNIPSAITYVVDGEELLLADDYATINNCLMIPLAPVGAVEVMLVQEQVDLETLMEQAFYAQRFVKSIIDPNSSWVDTLNAGSSGKIWKSSKGLCDEAIDPGLKSIERIEQKVQAKYAGRYERNRDYCRLSLIYNTVKHMISAIPRFLEYRFDPDGIQVIRIENRFLQPHPLGWRDVTILLKVRTQTRLANESHHIMELQLRLKGLAEVSHEAHKFYEEIRANLPDDLVTTILDRLVTDTTLDLGITKAEWLQCLPNKEVKKLLDAIGIPRRNRKALFDIIDIDGSGTVTSSELQEMLLLVKDPVHAHEVAGCHFRVRDIQQLLQTRLQPQLLTMHNFVVKNMEEHELILEDVYWAVHDIFNHVRTANGKDLQPVAPPVSPISTKTMTRSFDSVESVKNVAAGGCSHLLFSTSVGTWRQQHRVEAANGFRTIARQLRRAGTSYSLAEGLRSRERYRELTGGESDSPKRSGISREGAWGASEAPAFDILFL